jgi:hypothetical protein
MHCPPLHMHSGLYLPALDIDIELGNCVHYQRHSSRSGDLKSARAQSPAGVSQLHANISGSWHAIMTDGDVALHL